MIRVQRSAAPGDLSKAKVLNAIKALNEKNARGEKIFGREIASHWSTSGIRLALWNMQIGKCCYCDRRRDLARETDVDHFRPKASPQEAPLHPGYWWLAYDWNNLLLACKTCNSGHKGSHFPIEPRTKRAKGPSDDLARERALLLNPALDDCEKSLSYNWKLASSRMVVIKPKRGDLRAKTTIKILDLNSLNLSQQRADHFELVLRPIAVELHAIEKIPGLAKKKSECVKRLKLAISSEPFCGLARAYFRAEHLAGYFK